jgi:hypothetical protein
MHQGRSTNTWRGRQAALSITPVSKPAICAPALPRSRQPICVRFACCRRGLPVLFGGRFVSFYVVVGIGLIEILE